MANLNENPQHTPGKWFVEEDGLAPRVIGDVKYTQQGTLASLTHICDVNYGIADLKKWQQHNMANACRIAAAVNACDGIPTSALESGVVAQMVEALKDAIKFAPTTQPEDPSDGGNQDDIKLYGEDLFHYRLAEMIRPILSTLNPSDNG